MLVLLEQQGLTFMAEQAQALKAEAPLGRDVCLVSNRYGKSLCYPLLLFVMDYKLGRIYARTNAALVDRRGLAHRSTCTPLPTEIQIFLLLNYPCTYM